MKARFSAQQGIRRTSQPARDGRNAGRSGTEIALMETENDCVAETQQDPGQRWSDENRRERRQHVEANHRNDPGQDQIPKLRVLAMLEKIARASTPDVEK
jgi:hypothetical protein